MIIFMLLGMSCVHAQSIKTVSGEYIYHAPENITVELAKIVALQRAQIQAIADEFGTIVSQQNITQIQTGTEGTHSLFSSLSGSDVKGEWIETLGEPHYEISYDQGMLVVKCSVRGKAREILAVKTNFSAKALRNGKEDRFEDEVFKDGDDLYVSFCSPADGCVAVYLVDASGKVFCLLPYRSSSDGRVMVEAGKHYVFFSATDAAPLFTPADVDEYTLTCDQPTETNFLYIIYSPRPFTKAKDSQCDDTARMLLRELTFDDFQKWLSRLRIHDREMQVEKKIITLKKQ